MFRRKRENIVKCFYALQHYQKSKTFIANARILISNTETYARYVFQIQHDKNLFALSF